MRHVLRRLARRSLPRTDGVLELACLEAPVEVLRDRFGIPHIYAQGRRDLARAQGYVHAQDRLFQMETTRRFAFGRVSEVVGARGLGIDRVARRMRLGWAAERDVAACDAETAALVEAYCEGVNAFVERGPLPLEFRIARIPRERWTPRDVQAPAQAFALTLSGTWESELARARLRARLGDDRARRLEPGYPDDHPVTVDPALLANGLSAAHAIRGPVGAGGCSNCFAVAGTRTASGRPILANDPHLLLAIPGVWHAQHLVWDGGECAGFTIPGAPAVVLGRNRSVAWGMTTAMIDTQDVFVERLHPDDPHSYEVEGEWVAGEVVRELIRVRGRRRPEVEEVLVTRHGPVVVPPADGEREALAIRWSHHEPAETTRAFLDLMVAGDVEAADRALDRFAGPPHNFILADAHGAIGYRLAGGPIPRRRGWDGRVPAPGWTASHDWEGFIPQADLPRLRDPARGFVVSANNRIVHDDYAYDLGAEYLSGYRARRIETLLEPAAALTSEDAGAILLDRLSLPGLELAAVAADFASSDPLEQTALDLLRDWDGELTAASAAGAVYGALMSALERDAYADAIAEPLLETEGQSLPSGFLERSRPTLLRLLAARDDSLLPDGRTWDDVCRRSLTVAVRALGPDPEEWRRGKLHRLRLSHALAGVPALGRVFDRGPFEVGGDADTVAVMAPAGGRGAGSMIGPSMRAVFDLGDPDGNRISLVPGQSGHPASPHYDDLLRGWLRGELVPLAMVRTRVEELAEARLRLVPRAVPE